MTGEPERISDWSHRLSVVSAVANHAALLDQLVASSALPMWNADGTATVTVDAQLWHAAMLGITEDLACDGAS